METKLNLIVWTAKTHRVWDGRTTGTPKRWYGIRQFSIGLSAFYGIASPEVITDEYEEDNFPISGNYVTLAEAKDACEKIEAERLLTVQTIREALNPIYAEIKDAMDASIEKYVLPQPTEPATEPEPVQPEPVKAEWKHISGSVWELLQNGKDYYCLEKIASVDDRRTVWEAYETDNKINKEIYKGTFFNLKDAQFNAVHGMPLSYPTMIKPEATREPAAKPPETSAAELIWTEIPYGEKCVAKFHEFVIARESDEHFTLKHRRHSEANFIFVEGLLSMKAAKEVARLMEKVEHGNAAIRAANPENSEDVAPEAKPKLILRFKDGRKPINITNADRFEIGFQTDAVFLYLGADQQAVHAYKWSEMESISRVV